jgi:hypothetical protein
MKALPEILAKEATGSTLEIYRSIEAALGVRLVNLVYRHLATVPGALQWAWAVVGVGFSDETYRTRSASLGGFGKRMSVEPDRVGRISLARFGLTQNEIAAVNATLDAYNQANPMNALSLRVIALALSEGWRPPTGNVSISSPDPLVELLPMGRLEDLDREVSGHMTELAFFTTGERSGLVPSLFRHFSCWPAVLSGLCDWMRPLHERNVIRDLSDEISGEADRIAADIFNQMVVPEYPLEAPDKNVRDALSETIAQFLPAICRMIVIGGLMRYAIEERHVV